HGHREADVLTGVHLRVVRRLGDVDRRPSHTDLGRRVVRTVVAGRDRARVVDQTGLLTVATGRLVRGRGDVHRERRVLCRRSCRPPPRPAVAPPALDRAGPFPTSPLAGDLPGQFLFGRRRLRKGPPFPFTTPFVPHGHREADVLTRVHLRVIRRFRDVN